MRPRLACTFLLCLTLIRAGWLCLLKGENCFYYWLLYDRFTRTIYDVIESAHVQHLPASLAKLMKPFKFVLMESGKSAEVKQKHSVVVLFILSNTFITTVL